MNRDEFIETFRIGQCNEVLEKSLLATAHNAPHSHEFDAR